MKKLGKAFWVALALSAASACTTRFDVDPNGQGQAVDNGQSGQGGAAGQDDGRSIDHSGDGAGTHAGDPGGTGGSSDVGGAPAGVGGTGGGFTAGTTGGSTGGTTGGTAGSEVGGTGGHAGGDDSGNTGGSFAIDPSCDASSAYEPLVVRPGEVCYEFSAHSGDGESPYEVQLEESYNQFIYEIPWGDDVVATRFGNDFDNIAVIKGWTVFETQHGTPGLVEVNVTGTTLGENANAIAGWAVGDCNLELPADMGLELAKASSGKKLMIQWHHYNFTGAVQPDASRVQICTVPRVERANIGSLTWLGTEDLNGITGMPPGIESKFSGACLNETEGPITIVALWPHMHEIGTNMQSEILRVDGSTEVVLDHPFAFDYQIHYDLVPFIVMQPGDKIRTECTYFNNTAQNVAFGMSTKQEVCTQFAFAYPAGALDKAGNLSLIGATNTCWGD